jgi:Ca-activated chloride channel homolog
MKFAQPQVLWVLLAAVPALIVFLCWSWRVKQKLVEQFVRARLLSSLTIGVSTARQKVRLALLVAAVAGILLALARPQWGFAWEEARQQGLDIVVAIDTSKSMLAQDVAPNRLDRAKLATIDLMRLAKTDRLGLVAFAGSAFLQAPLTLDETAFQQAVDAVSVGIIPQGGTALSEAIKTAQAAFEKGNDNHKVLVLFTDGEDHDAEEETIAAAKDAAQDGMRIFTIGVGTPEGELLRVPDEQGNPTFVKDENGDVVKSHLNQTLLQEIATDAGGFYLPLQGANPMETLYTRGLAPLPKSEETTRLTRVYRERYHWPLGFAVLCLVIELLLPESPRTRRTEAAASAAPALAQTAALLILLLAGTGVRGSPSGAYHDFQNGDYTDSFKEYNRLADKKTNDYRLHYDAGAAAYKAQKLDSALQQFDAALNSAGIVSDPKAQQQAYYNLGNTLYRMGDPLPDPDKKQKCWQQSIDSFSRALHLNTNDLDAKNNLAYVKQKLEELKQQQQQQKKNDQNQDKKDQDKKDQQQQQNQDKKKDQDQKQSSKQDQNQKQQQDQQQQKKSDEQKKDEEKARQEQAQKDQEEKQQEAQQGDNSKEQGEQTAMAQSRMTPEEARQLLEQQKDDEKVLIFAPENKQMKRQDGKNW